MGSAGKFGLSGAVSAVMLAAALFGAACTSGETLTGGGDPLIIGHLSNFQSYENTHYNAVALAAAHFNLAGGVNGSPVVVISRNTSLDKAHGVQVVRKLVEENGPVAFVGPPSSVMTIAIAESVNVPGKRAQISPSATSPAITELEDDDFVFRTAVSDRMQGVVLANLAWEVGYDRVGVMHIDDPYGQGLADQFEETFTALGGTVAKVSHQLGKSTYIPELERAKAGGSQALVPISHEADTQTYVREALDGGYFDKFLLVDASKNVELLEAIGWEALESSMGTSPGSPPDRQQSRAFYGAYADYYDVEPQSEAFVAESYDATVVIALAAAKAGSVTDPVAIRDALRSVSNPPGEIVGPGVEGIMRALALIADDEDVNYEGASGAVDFDENGDVAGTIEIWKVEGGEIKSTGRFESP